MESLSLKDKEILLQSIRDIPDFPKEGIVFKDITTLLSNPHALTTLMTHLEKRYAAYDLDYIAGIDARGFIFGSILADRLGIGFVTLRKKGKLPFHTLSESYSLEYGSDELEIHSDAFAQIPNAKVLLIDDLIATGGTAKAAVKLIERSNAQCIEACFIMELSFLKGFSEMHVPHYSVLEIA